MRRAKRKQTSIYSVAKSTRDWYGFPEKITSYRQNNVRPHASTTSVHCPRDRRRFSGIHVRGARTIVTTCARVFFNRSLLTRYDTVRNCLQIIIHDSSTTLLTRKRTASHARRPRARRPIIDEWTAIIDTITMYDCATSALSHATSAFRPRNRVTGMRLPPRPRSRAAIFCACQQRDDGTRDAARVRHAQSALARWPEKTNVLREIARTGRRVSGD